MQTARLAFLSPITALMTALAAFFAAACTTASAAASPPAPQRGGLRSHSLRAAPWWVVLGGWLLATASGLAQAQQMVSVSKQAYLREGAGTEHAAQWLLDPGYPLAVLGRQGNWLQVRDFEDDTGWIYRPLTAATRHHVVTSNTANIRRGPSTRTPVMGQAKYGEVLKTLEKRAQWVKVKKPGGPTGWVASRLLWGW